MDIKQEFKYLGVVRANPNEYMNRYGDSLISKTKIPNVLNGIKLPNMEQDEDSEEEELIGDVDALAMVDLEREGLGHYRNVLAKRGLLKINVFHPSNKTARSNELELQNLAERVFRNIAKLEDSNRISYTAAEQILTQLGFNRGPRMKNIDLNAYFTSLDKNKRGSLGLDEFKQAFLNLWILSR